MIPLLASVALLLVGAPLAAKVNSWWIALILPLGILLFGIAPYVVYKRQKDISDQLVAQTSP